MKLCEMCHNVINDTTKIIISKQTPDADFNEILF